MATLLHPRNPHRNGYDFGLLLAKHPPLQAFVTRNPQGKPTVNFHDPAAVKCLNQALLLTYYRLDYWDIPDAYLCPAVPGRADYLHYVADLLAEDRKGKVPRGSRIRVLDIGTGANVVYPIVGSAAYGWSFVGTDVDAQALAAAQTIVDRNQRLHGKLELRLQPDVAHLLQGVTQSGEYFDLVVCNPPFYGSAAEAAQETQRKRRGLGAKGKPVRNFGGQSNELWYPGGERAFIGTLIAESARQPTCAYWYTSLVAKRAHLTPLEKQLHQLQAR
ncbi:MAG: 23S rRNA (adenine(1618)-N(6))-methyltransferase RlmF, partial [Bacteroidetes bacterium]